MKYSAPLLSLLTLSALFAGTALAEKPADSRPNILWIVVEDMSPWMPAYGDETVKTPNIEALAGQGVVFDKCIATSPVCSPSRSALITGCWQTRLGTHQHRSSRTPGTAIELPEHVKTVPELFREAGYFTFNHGKDDYNFAYDRNKLYADGIKPKSYGFYGPHGYGEWSQRKEGQPFFGQIMLLGGKLKKKHSDPIDPAKVKVPPYYPDCEAMRDEIASHYDDIRMTDDELGQIIARLKKDGLYENTVIFFFSDHGCDMPRHKSLLYDGGLHVPLVVAWPGHAARVRYDGHPIRKDQSCLMDVAATSLALAGIRIPRWMDSRDMFAKSYLRDATFAAKDRCDWCIDRIRAVRTNRFKYIRNYKTDRPALGVNDYRSKKPCFQSLRRLHQEGKLTPAQGLILSGDRPAEELYDLQADPHEVKNLLGDPKHAQALAKLRASLDKWIKQTDDKGQYPESDAQMRVLVRRWGRRCILPEFEPFLKKNE